MSFSGYLINSGVECARTDIDSKARVFCELLNWQELGHVKGISEIIASRSH